MSNRDKREEQASFSTFRTYRGSMSQVSGQSVPITSTEHYSEELSTSELIKLVTDTKIQIRILRIENEILERTIMRLDPTMMNQVNQALEFANKMQTQSVSAGSCVLKSQSRLNIESLISSSRVLISASRVSTRRSESMGVKMGILGTSNKINVLERQEMVATEMGQLMRHLERMKIKSDKQYALLKAMIEEVIIRASDCQKHIELFKQKVITEGWNKIAQRIPAEVWVRFMNEWAKETDSQIAKLRLRTSTLNTQCIRFRSEIGIKSDFKETLRPVDFEKIKIENVKCSKSIEKKLFQLAEIKAMTGDANLNLTVHRKAMDKQNKYLMEVVDKIKNRKNLVKLIDKERDKIFSTLDALENRVKFVRKARLKYLVPDVMEYVKVKSEISDAEREIKILEGRLHLLNLNMKSMQSRLRKSFPTGVPCDYRKTST